MIQLCTPILFLYVALQFFPGIAIAETALVAVATSFSHTAKKLITDFEDSSDQRITLTSGATGKLYAQTLNGAPFDILLAADQERPRLLEQSGHGVDGSRFVYSIGKLVLWSVVLDEVSTDGFRALQSNQFRSIAIANPELAPYGLAAKEALLSQGLWDDLAGKIVMGENVGQTHALVATRNAELGFVALSSVLAMPDKRRGIRWDVPSEWYSPIRQEAILLDRGSGNEAARAFMRYLATESAKATIESYGFDVD